MAEFLFASKAITEELRNGKLTKMSGGNPGQTSPFWPCKICPKDLYFTPSLLWLNFCMFEATLTKN